ncbi:MAG: hypothetical protein H0X30_26155 [Anaerolineae bacterium]|nr:hypothetical protein [Anaerolineae bacterium]
MAQQITQELLPSEYDYLERRFYIALGYSIAAVVSVLVALFLLSLVRHDTLPQIYKLYLPFVGWNGDSHALRQFPIVNWDQEIIQQLYRLFYAAVDVENSVGADHGHVGSIAGIARLCTLVTVISSVFILYRRDIRTHYKIYDQPTQLENFNKMSPVKQGLARFLYVGATTFGTYVIVSIMWLGLSQVFKNLSFNDGLSPAIAILLFTGLITFITTFGALAVTTHEVLLLGLGTLGIGFMVSFALAQPNCRQSGFSVPLLCLLPVRQWWEIAVSNAGQSNPSASLFTGSLLSGAITFIVVWFDIDNTVIDLANKLTLRWFKPIVWISIARFLFTVFILGLLFVGFIRVAPEFPMNRAFHTGGAVSAIISALALACIMPKQSFRPWYKLLSIGLGAVTAIMIVLGALNLVSLTVIELTVFVMIGLWIYATVDSLLAQANINYPPSPKIESTAPAEM